MEWRTIEEPISVVDHLSAGEVVLLDCLTLWVSNLMMHRGMDTDLTTDFVARVEGVAATNNHVILVTNEVGLGIVPMNAMARRFRDNTGWLAQRVARVCDRVEHCVVGIPMRVK